MPAFREQVSFFIILPCFGIWRDSVTTTRHSSTAVGMCGVGVIVYRLTWESRRLRLWCSRRVLGESLGWATLSPWERDLVVAHHWVTHLARGAAACSGVAINVCRMGFPTNSKCGRVGAEDVASGF